jgi:hypothetical protein
MPTVYHPRSLSPGQSKQLLLVPNARPTAPVVFGYPGRIFRQPTLPVPGSLGEIQVSILEELETVLPLLSILELHIDVVGFYGIGASQFDLGLGHMLLDYGAILKELYGIQA